MANPLKGEVALTVDGRDLMISFPINALIEMEDKLGKPVNQILATLNDTPSLKTLRTLLFFGLKTGQPEITEDEAGVLMSFDSGAEVIAKMFEAIRLAFPSAKEGQAEAGAGPQ